MAYPKQHCDTKLTLRLPSALKRRIKKKAETERRSLNAQIVKMLADSDIRKAA